MYYSFLFYSFLFIWIVELLQNGGVGFNKLAFGIGMRCFGMALILFVWSLFAVVLLVKPSEDNIYAPLARFLS